MLNTISHKGNANQNHKGYLFTPTSLAIIEKTDSNECWRLCAEIGTTTDCWWKCKIVQPFWKTVWQFLKELNIGLYYDPQIPSLSLYPREMKIYAHTKTRK